MNSRIDISKLIKGTIQGAQTPGALNPRHFLADERDKMQLLSYCINVASVLDYYNMDNTQDGTWDSFLLADVSILSAWIAQCDSSKDYADFLNFLKGIESERSRKKQESFAQRFFNAGFDVVLRIDAWYKLSKQNFESNSITTYLHDTIGTEGSSLLSAFYYYYFSLTENLPSFKNEVVDRFQGLDPIWEFNPFPDAPTKHLSLLEKKIFLIRMVKAAADKGQLLFNLQADIGNRAKDDFEISIKRNDIPPHIGLMLSFLDIFRTQAEAMNSLTSRHLDFYYHEVLRGVKKPATPDAAFVILQLAKGKNFFTLPEGTQLSAGKDVNGNPIIFTTDSETVISSTQILQYLTLSFPSAGSMDNIYKGVVHDFNSAGNTVWPLFGGNTPTPNLAIDTATIGFAFSCADLLLLQGSRTVNITFTFSGDAQDAFKEADLSRYFDLRLTASDGWYNAAVDQVTYTAGIQTLLLSFLIEPTDPAIVAYNEKVHGAGFESIWPVCEISLGTSGKQAYQSLQTLKISNVSITTTVTGVFEFLVENDSGKLSANTPFIPFNDPSPGANLYIGSQEFFIKPLTYFKLTIAWDKLPSGFKNYYQAYNDYYNDHGISHTAKAPVFQNQVFKAKMYALNGEVWTPVTGQNENPDEYCLFTDETSEKFREAPFVPNGVKVISVNGPFPFNSHIPSYTGLDNSLREGFFCLSLSDPPKGFGAIDYPNIVSYVTLENSVATIHNARLVVIKKKKIKPLPSVPYIPKVSGLEVAYGSSQEYSPGLSVDLKWYHVHPFGIEPVSFQQSSVSMLPSYPGQAYAYFGLDTVQSGTSLSLFLTINNKVKSVATSSPQGLTYEYLTAEGWRALTIDSDSTNGFQRTGVLRLPVPADITNEGSGVPPQLYWLRFGQQIYTEIPAAFVSTQALTVVRDLTMAGDYSPVASGSITRFVNPVPEIKTVMQPVNSFGGTNGQTTSEFRSAMAGRLRYKGRTMSASDIEGVLLNEFPQLFKATAIPAGYGDPKSIGLVNVIVTPWTSINQDSCYEPLVPLDLMLNILDFLQKTGMPAARYEISNAEFYELRVTCSVTFNQPNANEELANTLNTDIRNFLSPWIQDNPLKEDVPRTNSPGMLYAFIKSRPYVRYVSAFKCDILKRNEKDFVLPIGTVSSPCSEAAIHNIPQSLIISAAQHDINVIPSTGQATEKKIPDGLRVGENFYLTD